MSVLCYPNVLPTNFFYIASLKKVKENLFDNYSLFNMNLGVKCEINNHLTSKVQFYKNITDFSSTVCTIT